MVESEPATRHRCDVDARGERRKFLAAFVIHQLRCKKTEKKSVVSEGKSSTSEKFKELHWWAMEEMDKQMGEKKGLAWRQSGKLPKRPCPVTNSEEEHLVVYGIPKNWRG